MASNTKRTIILKGRSIRKEASASGTVLPGHLIMIDSAGKYKVHNVAGGVTERLFAVENEVFGKGIDTAYVAGPPADVILAESCFMGMEVNALVAAAASAIVIGDMVESAGDGTVRKATSLTDLTSAAGTPAAGTVDVGGGFVQATLNNNFATIVARLAAMTPQGVAGVIGIAQEAVDNSAGGAVARIRISIV